MENTIEYLKKCEASLMKKIKNMRDGAPKWKANQNLSELRTAIKILKSV